MSNEHEIMVTIQSGRGSKEFRFPQQTKVQDAANEAARAFGYPDSERYALVRATGEELEGQRTLVSYHIQNGEILSLSATGSGV